jgi:hypothetical protein
MAMGLMVQINLIVRSEKRALKKYKKDTVIIDVRPISTLDFLLADVEKDFLLKEGKVAAFDFLIKKKMPGVSKEQLKEAIFEAKKAKQEVIKLRNGRKRKNRLFNIFLVILIFRYLFWYFFTF